MKTNEWSKWIHPVRRGYLCTCCGCGLTHEVDFRFVYKYKLLRSGQIQFRVRRAAK